MRILIVEDELPTALDLKRTILEAVPDAEISAILDSVESTVAWLQKKPAPDMAFFDIHLGDGLCFEVFKSVTVTFPIVFCTAYEDYMLQAFQTNGIDYILKPFNNESVQRALEKVKRMENFFQQKNGGDERLTTLLNALSKPAKHTFVVNQKDKIIPIGIQEIAFFYIENEVTFLFTFDARRFILNYTMDELEEKVDPKQFFRANRQYLVNRKSITEAQQYFARKLLIKTNPAAKEPLIVSKSKSPDFVQWLEGA
jgi:two-component system, LytTR family, response regulator LytT